MKVRCKQRFSTTVMHRGGNVFVRGVEGESIDLDPEIVELVNREIPDALVEDTPKPKPKSSNRQVAKAPNRRKG